MEPSALLLGLANAISPHAVRLASKLGKSKYDEFIATYTNVFSDHIASTLERCSRVKSLLHRDEALNIDDQYVGLEFSTSNKTVTDKDILQSLTRGPDGVLVSGLAGSGKSMFMKWAALRLVESVPNSQRIPLFIELRDVPHERLELPIDQLIFQQSSSESSDATFGQFHVGLTNGMFIVLLDGLDEVPLKHRDIILTEISDFRRRFPKAAIVCSSRPNRALESSTGLKVAHVNPMTLPQITSVITNAVFDESKKCGFIQQLSSGLYKNHRSFLSNPLLATIMLITFDFSTEIPSRLSLFYSQVFEALFYKHDSSKGIYKREHYSGLEIDRFERVFRSFCFQTYATNEHSFEMSDLTDRMRKALKYSHVEGVSASDFVQDCMQSLSLLQEDGPHITFVHRTFQEYFAARFLLFYVGDHSYQLFDGVAGRSLTDSTLQMLTEMNADAVLKSWVVPKLSERIVELGAVDLNDPKEIVGFISKYSTAITISDDIGHVLAWTWGAAARPTELAALNMVLTTTGVAGRLDLFDGPFLLGWEDGLEGLQLSEDLAAEIEAAEFEEVDGDRCFELGLGRNSEKWIKSTEIPGMLRRYQEQMLATKKAILKRLEVSNAFAEELTDIF